MDFTEFKEEHLKSFESYLEKTIEEKSNTQLEESMNYSLNAKGKRLRPLLLLATLYFFNKEIKLGYEAAGSLEMIHTYSLIHDDLPAMDGDSLRRGKPTNHVLFSQATAILAGDSLLTHAFELLADSNLSAEKIVSLVKLLAETAGYKGMVGGQQADINGESNQLSLEELKAVHSRKTGELIRFALVGGGIISDQNESILENLSAISHTLGIAYQIRDDILDVIGNEKELGKAIGADVKLDKSTYPSLLGLDQAKKQLSDELDQAKDKIKEIANDHTNEDVLIDFINLLYLKEQ